MFNWTARSALSHGVLLSFLVAFSACGSLSHNSARSSQDESVNFLIRSSDDSGTLTDTSAAGTSERVDGVQFVINQNLDTVPVLSDDSEFPELQSAFEAPDHTWRPRKGFSIPVVKNDRVDRWIRYFTGPLRSHYGRWLKRASYYGPMIEEILKEYHLPTDLIYLAMIESGFNLNAYSRAHAAGPWQFIRSTGRMYGLDSGGLVDERRNVVQSTRAAAAHLRDLHRLYGDWYLAFAAYNAGAGRVNQAIARSGTRNFWKMSGPGSRYLRQETRDYVPRILAAAIIAKDYRKYGFSPQMFEKAVQFDEVTVPDATDITVIARCARTTEEEIRFLNPALVAGVTPPDKHYVVNVPEGSAGKFTKNYSKIPRNQRVNYAFHKVKKRETLASVARHYGMSGVALAKLNRLGQKPRIYPGTHLMIPKKKQIGPSLDKILGPEEGISPEVEIAALKQPTTEELFGPAPSAGESGGGPPKTPVNTAALVGGDGEETVAVEEEGDVFEEIATPVAPPRYYQVKRGDTLSSIAKIHGVLLSDLRGWNNLRSGSVIKTGQRVRVSSGESPSEPTSGRMFFTHRVRKGETLSVIARHYGVAVASLKNWNGLGKKGMIRSGQNLRILTGGAGSEKELASLQGADSLAGTDDRPKLIVHAVRRGDTLWKLANLYGVTVSQIKEWNRLSTNSLRPQQKIRIYALRTLGVPQVALVP